jgi:hypothetical protein
MADASTASSPNNLNCESYERLVWRAVSTPLIVAETEDLKRCARSIGMTR